MKNAKKTIIVTGGAGFIGGNFVHDGKAVPCRLLLSPDIRSLNTLLRKLGVSSGD